MVVEVVYSSNDEYRLLPLLVKKKKDEVIWEEVEGEFASIAELKKKVKTNTPIVLSIVGRGIISRVFQDDLEGEDAVLKAMPNINLPDFYWNTSTTDDYSIVTISRNETVDELFENFKSEGFRILEVFIGPVAINLDILDRAYETLSLSLYDVTIEEDRVTAIKSAESERINYSIGDKVISSTHLNSLFVGVQFLTNSLRFETSEDLCEEFNKEEGLKQVFDKVVIVTVLFYFVVLLSNFFLKDYYAVKFSELNSSMQFYLSKKKNLENLREDRDYKRTLLFSSGIMDGNNITMFSDQIGASVPSGVVLNRLAIAPVKGKRRKKKEKIRYDKDRIVLEGEAQNARNFNNWVVELKEFDWQKNINIANYTRNPKTGWSDFTIEIELDN